jgi:hypothetical protein
VKCGDYNVFGCNVLADFKTLNLKENNPIGIIVSWRREYERLSFI